LWAFLLCLARICKMCFFICFPDTPPEKVSTKGSKGAQYNQFLEYQNNPNTFALGLKDACCKEPLCCCLSGFGAGCGFTACWARSKVLDTYYKGTEDFVCCQGYIPGCCCIQPAECCKGSIVGLFCEGCCFPMTSLSVARLHMMDTKRIRPDPCDWQIIAFANCLQLIACIFHIAAIFAEELREAAAILDLIADLVMLSVAGCMGAQVYHETKLDKANAGAGGVTVVQSAPPIAMAQPVGQPPVAVARPVGAPLKCEEMER